jgi:hypothetical protein
MIGQTIALPANGVPSTAGGPNFAEIAFDFRIGRTVLVVGRWCSRS